MRVEAPATTIAATRPAGRVDGNRIAMAGAVRALGIIGLQFKVHWLVSRLKANQRNVRRE